MIWDRRNCTSVGLWWKTIVAVNEAETYKIRFLIKKKYLNLTFVWFYSQSFKQI